MDNIRVRKWKSRGLIESDEDISKILKIFNETTNCNKCEILLTNVNCGNQKCMDHDHKTGKFRGILCKSCNLHTDRKKQIYKRMSEEERKERQKISHRKTDEKRKNNPDRIKYNKEYNKQYREKNKDKFSLRDKNYHLYRNSWGGAIYSYSCNLLRIDINLFN